MAKKERGSLGPSPVAAPCNLSWAAFKEDRTISSTAAALCPTLYSPAPSGQWAVLECVHGVRDRSARLVGSSGKGHYTFRADTGSVSPGHFAGLRETEVMARLVI